MTANLRPELLGLRPASGPNRTLAGRLAETYTEAEMPNGVLGAIAAENSGLGYWAIAERADEAHQLVTQPTPAWQTVRIQTLPARCTCAHGPLCGQLTAWLESQGREGDCCDHLSCLIPVHEMCDGCMAAGYEDTDDFCTGCGDVVRAGFADHDGGTFVDFDGTLASWGDGAPYHPLCLILKRRAERTAR